MNSRHILICPLNWGLGHAGRMIPLATALMEEGHIITFAADKSLFPILRAEMPGVTLSELPGIRMHYSKHLPQYLSILLHLPHLLIISVKEHFSLKSLVNKIKPDVIISDNRFGLWHKKIFSVYVTHMLCIPFPRFLRVLEPAGVWMHRQVIRKYDICLIPDYPGTPNLSGRLSHGMKLPDKYHYMGPLSRFNASSHLPLLTHLPVPYRCLILSGPEPQRSLFRDLVISSTFDKHLVILSSTGETGSASSLKSITVVTNPDTEMMRGFIAASEMVICRSGYTSLMELMSLGKDAVIIPTPGQTEQEYLGKYLNARSFTYNNKVFVFQTLMQGDVAKIRELKTENTSENNCFPDAQSLFREALIMLSEKKKE